MYADWSKVIGVKLNTHPLKAPDHAPVADPGLTKKWLSYSIAWNLSSKVNRSLLHVGTTHICVCPEIRTSTSICLASELSESKSPVGMHWCPWITPILMGAWTTVKDNGNKGFWMAVNTGGYSGLAT
jgi:hypothetical protein